MGNEVVESIIYTTLAFLLMSIAVLVFAYFSRKKVLETKLQKKQLEVDLEKKLTQATILSQEEERSRLAKELHDDINARVNIVTLNAGILKDMELSDSERTEVLNKLIAQCKGITESIRHISHNLLPPELEKFGLVRAVEELCNELNATGKVKVTFNCQAKIPNTDNIRNLYVYRVIQELTKNSMTHGDAKNIQVSFEQDGEKYTCTYTDDGTGFELDKAIAKPGLGLKNIQSRLKYLGSEFTVARHNPQGVYINFNF